MKKTEEKTTATMKPIDGIAKEIKLIRAKLEINARDWSKAEKDAIADAYAAITKVSTGKARVLDKGCDSCVNSAVNIIKNYCAAIGEPITTKMPKPASKATPATVTKKNTDDDSNDDEGEEGNDDGLLIAPSNGSWRSNHETINEAAKEVDYTFTEKEVTKKERITALELHLKKINE